MRPILTASVSRPICIGNDEKSRPHGPNRRRTPRSICPAKSCWVCHRHRSCEHAASSVIAESAMAPQPMAFRRYISSIDVRNSAADPVHSLSPSRIATRFGADASRLADEQRAALAPEAKYCVTTGAFRVLRWRTCPSGRPDRAARGAPARGRPPRRSACPHNC
jgi:hypothetical protein